MAGEGVSEVEDTLNGVLQKLREKICSFLYNFLKFLGFIRDRDMLRAFGVSRVVSNGMGTLAGHGGGRTWGSAEDLVVTAVTNGKEVFTEEEMVTIEPRSESAWVNGAVTRQCSTQ